MAKEMIIIFVYDTELLQREEDDPASAILYFHPGWVSDQQRTALCGQIIGSSHFLRTTFSSPRIFALQSGKFFIHTYGRYLMAVGTDRNIADWVLEHRADLLRSLITFYHQDLLKMAELYQGSASLSAKLYHMFETYLKILTYGGHMFFNIPTIQLPKSASHVFLEAIQLLESCQQKNCVLGGTILYHNKVVATQLSSDLTKKLVLTDPYRIKSPAEMFDLNLSLPLGVQLLQVYIAHEDYRNLYEDASKSKSISQYLNKINLRKPSKVTTREPILSAMKRDQSLIFTTVPEEDGDHSPSNAHEYKSPDRPKFLNLKSKTTDVKVPTTASGTPFFGQTSVCSTPMTDLNKVLHNNPMSICVNPEESFVNIETRTSINMTDKFDSCVPYVPESNVFDRKRSASMWELREKLKIFNKRITMRYYSLGLSSLGGVEVELECVPKLVRHKTISDPNHPIFKPNGLAVSNFLYRQYLEEPFINMIESSDAHRKEESPKKGDSRKMSPIKTLQKLMATSKSKENRKSLTLPLKSLTSETENGILNRPNGGVQLTPLMSKLSLLAMEDRSSGFCSKDTTPGDRDLRFTPSQSNYSFLSRRKSSVSEDYVPDTTLHKAVLFICGQQDMVMGILLEESVRHCTETVNELWERCTESLGKLERQLRHCLESYSGGSSQSETTEPYSYLCMDPQWDNVRRGGPWGAMELGMLTHLHRDFINIQNLTEITVRNDDIIVYGHHCGKTEVFYQQSTAGASGLPTPADPMGTVSLKAKRRLERDHAIVLL
uniref:CCZ1/INTU/HSP4 first Longin domain-containing protein n=2 Tax=Photinus pyralis TaxID=7054 RepID=A0A1Y1K6Y7_PHOPY